ncbi:hypothetical protein [uncultured Dysosmobacter sp.]|uniref:hypothetical protein n=1 Tax=uncultured Dysosmobacter sp. TaxID=2591384 RepID=UPI0026249F4C|nr:hypothetical protein [uncultured Dysosmobacter sp.]
MGKIFEDELMELHSECIALCLETVPNANKVYAYCSIEKTSSMFNAFFEVNGEIKTLGKLCVDRNATMRFLATGTGDLEKYEELGERYGQPVPTEIKLVYDVRSKRLDAQYRYDEVCASDNGVCAEDVFMDWCRKVQDGNS